MWPCPRLLLPLYLEIVRGRTPLQDRAGDMSFIPGTPAHQEA